MTLEECYAAMNADYGEILGRLRKESLIQKLLLMLPKDPSFALLAKSLEAQDYETAFRAAHTLKGVSLNLGITPLAKSASELTEALRNGADTARVPDLYAAVSADYQKTVDTIAAFSAGLAQ